MGIFDALTGRKESLAIIDLVKEVGMVDKKIYFDNNFFYHGYDGEIDKYGENVYNKKDIEWVLVKNSYEGDTDCIIYSVEGEEVVNRKVDRQVITMVYLKLQEYVKEFKD